MKKISDKEIQQYLDGSASIGISDYLSELKDINSQLTETESRILKRLNEFEKLDSMLNQAIEKEYPIPDDLMKKIDAKLEKKQTHFFKFNSLINLFSFLSQPVWAASGGAVTAGLLVFFSLDSLPNNSALEKKIKNQEAIISLLEESKKMATARLENELHDSQEKLKRFEKTETIALGVMPNSNLPSRVMAGRIAEIEMGTITYGTSEKADGTQIDYSSAKNLDWINFKDFIFKADIETQNDVIMETFNEVPNALPITLHVIPLKEGSYDVFFEQQGKRKRRRVEFKLGKEIQIKFWHRPFEGWERSTSSGDWEKSTGPVKLTPAQDLDNSVEFKEGNLSLGNIQFTDNTTELSSTIELIYLLPPQ